MQRPCDTDTYDNEEIIRRMMDEQKDMKIPVRTDSEMPEMRKSADNESALGR